MIDIDRDTLGDFERAARLEWLETNGLGDWAGSTLTGAHSRRDHHLLRLPGGAAEERADHQRTTVALAKLDEMVVEGGRAFELACNRFPFLVAAPGSQHLAGFRRDLFPVFEHQAGDVRLRKTIAMLAGESTLVVLYEVLAAPGPFVLALRPFFACREPHALGSSDRPGAAPEVSRDPSGLLLRWLGAEIHLAAQGADFERRRGTTSPGRRSPPVTSAAPPTACAPPRMGSSRPFPGRRRRPAAPARPPRSTPSGSTPWPPWPA